MEFNLIEKTAVDGVVIVLFSKYPKAGEAFTGNSLISAYFANQKVKLKAGDVSAIGYATDEAGEASEGYNVAASVKRGEQILTGGTFAAGDVIALTVEYNGKSATRSYKISNL